MNRQYCPEGARKDAKKYKDFVFSLFSSWRPCGRPLGSIGGFETDPKPSIVGIIAAGLAGRG
jgi:hypothetical protein